MYSNDINGKSDKASPIFLFTFVNSKTEDKASNIGTTNTEICGAKKLIKSYHIIFQ